MPKQASFFALLALIAAISAGMLLPASAEFFGCNDNKSSKVLASYGSAGGHRYSHEYSAQAVRPRITIHPRRSHASRHAKRYCRSWLAKEYRVSGPVIVPQMRCVWR